MLPMIRCAGLEDVPAMHAIRLDVRENRRSSSARVTEQDYHPYVAAGSAWFVENDGKVVGFAVADGNNVWALFVSPLAEAIGIGRLLHRTLIAWAKALNLDQLTLTTAAGTRAEGFYRRLGWVAVGNDPDGSMRFMFRVDRTDH